MIVGIVGAEGAKFTDYGQSVARAYIEQICYNKEVTGIVSGACHLGGIDQWAAEVGQMWNILVMEFPPKSLSWEHGYKPRNLLIARACDVLYNIVVDKLPPDFKGMTHKLCYHCQTSDHVKSGGCWTAKQAQRLGKPAHWITVIQ